MSLYEQFHSDINKNYMFDMIKGIILKEIEVDLSEDESNKEYYLSTFEPIFKENDLLPCIVKTRYCPTGNTKY